MVFLLVFFFEEDSYDLYTDQKRKPRPIPLKILLKNTICSTPVTKYRVHPIKRCLGHFYKKIYGYATINNSTWYKKTRYGKGKRPKSYTKFETEISSFIQTERINILFLVTSYPSFSPSPDTATPGIQICCYSKFLFSLSQRRK
jgi:hypothetical protein